MEYDGGPPHGFGLSRVFQLFESAGKPSSVLRRILEDNLLMDQIPDRYDVIAQPFWHRIYTTNIDDSLDIIYRPPQSATLQTIPYPDQVVPERNQFLESIQAIYLHGKLPCNPSKVTFSMRQYASRADGFDRLYDHFVGDYSIQSTVFLGTELDEPLFFQYIEARDR